MIWCDSTMIGSIVFFLDLLDGIPQQSLTGREFRPGPKEGRITLD